MSDIDNWRRVVAELKRQRAAIQQFKDESHYRKLKRRPRCCATCQHGSIFEAVPTCFCGPESFEIDPFGICDRYKED